MLPREIWYGSRAAPRRRKKKSCSKSFARHAAHNRTCVCSWCPGSANASSVSNRDAVILMDTIGELGALWGLADVAFVGGSLDGRRGGQNMIEPAAEGAGGGFG